MGLFDTTVPSTNPPDSEAWKLGAQRIRELKNTLQTILGVIFSSASTFVNGGIPADAIGAGTTGGMVRAQMSSSAAIPAGVILDYGGTTAPAGWLICDGLAVSRSTYSDLFIALGTHFGVGDGVTTFNLPDLRGRVAVGLDNMGAGAAARLTAGTGPQNHPALLGSTGGEENHANTVGQLPAHDHGGLSGLSVLVTDGTNTPAGTSGGPVTKPTSSVVFSTSNTGQMTGAAHNNMPPYQACTKIIKT